MERAPHTTLSLVAGPLLGLLLIAVLFIVRGGPGLVLFTLVTSVSLTVLAPIFQLFLLKRQGIAPFEAAALAIGSIVLLAVISTFTGIFSFW
jgi:hypothetical protein